MKVLACSLILALSFAGTVTLAQTDEPVVEEIAEDGPDILSELSEIPSIFQESLACDLLGPLAGDEPNVYDKYGAGCDLETNSIDAFMPGGGVNWGLIERLNAVGFNTNTWRIYLADPDNLENFAVNGADTLSEIIEISTSGLYTFMSEQKEVAVTARESLLETLEDFSAGLEATNFYEAYGKGFIARRQIEALPEHRNQIAEIWKRIMSEQIERYMDAGE